MVNKPKKIGTEYENHVLNTYLTRIWPGADRPALKGVNDYGDFINTGAWLIEAKKRKRLWGEIIKWVLVVMSKVRWKAQKHLSLTGGERPSARDRDEYAMEHLPWAIFMAGDKRQDPNIDLALMPAEWATRLIEFYERTP